jgi:hypothetical protein
VRAPFHLVCAAGLLALSSVAVRAADATGVWHFDAASNAAYAEKAATAMASAYTPEQRQQMQAEIAKAEAQVAELQATHPDQAAGMQRAVDTMKQLAADPHAYFKSMLEETAKELADATIELQPGGAALSRTGATPDDIQKGHWTQTGDEIDIVLGEDDDAEMRGTLAGDRLEMRSVMAVDESDPAGARMAQAMNDLTFVLVRR